MLQIVTALVKNADSHFLFVTEEREPSASYADGSLDLLNYDFSEFCGGGFEGLSEDLGDSSGAVPFSAFAAAYPSA